jgi:hypothetical protein
MRTASCARGCCGISERASHCGMLRCQTPARACLLHGHTVYAPAFVSACRTDTIVAQIPNFLESVESWPIKVPCSNGTACPFWCQIWHAVWWQRHAKHAVGAHLGHIPAESPGMVLTAPIPTESTSVETTHQVTVAWKIISICRSTMVRCWSATRGCWARTPTTFRCTRSASRRSRSGRRPPWTSTRCRLYKDPHNNAYVTFGLQCSA